MESATATCQSLAPQAAARRAPQWALAALLLAELSAVAVAAPPNWWNTDWPYRVRLECEAGEGDVAWVRVTLAGHTTPDGRDPRLVDADGSPRPFELLHHDPQLASLVRYQVPPGEALKTWLYFGNAGAPQIKTTSAPAEGGGKAWEPRRGVLLRVYRKAKPGHPSKLSDLRQMIRAGQLDGAGFCDGISDGFNRFGPSDQYISVYEGYLPIEPAGTYAFCSCSDDGSWILANDHMLVEWPGEHGFAGCEHGEHSGECRLPAGVARIQYFHEEGTGGQMAFLGWKPPGAESFGGIPTSAWLGVRTARAVGYEARERPVLAVPDVRILSTYWVRDSDNRQATLVQLWDRSSSRAGEIASTRWSFGDGTEGEGRKLQHVYFRTGRPEIQLTVTDAKGNSDTVTCSIHVFYVDVEARYFKFGSAKEYAEAAAGYDVEHMAQDDLQSYADFWGFLENWAEHARAADAFIRRFPDSPAAVPLIASEARACTQPTAYDPNRANELYKLSLRSAEKNRQRLELMFERARVLAWGLDDPQQATALFNEIVSQTVGKDAPPLRRLHRLALIGLADVALLSRRYEEAERGYRAVQDSDAQKLEQPEVLAKIGAYGYSVLDLLARDEFDWALKTLDRWEDELPVQKLEGYTFFLRGKVLFVWQPGPLALRYLELAERVCPRAVHVPEAAWLRANCLLTLGRYEQALTEFQRIRTDFTESEFLAGAAEKIAICRSKLQPGGE